MKELTLFILNAADCFFTLTWIHLGIATEANPLMAYLINLGFPVFISFKLIVGILAAAVFFYTKDNKISRVCSTIGIIIIDSCIKICIIKE